MLRNVIKSQEEARERINKEVEAFLKAGGKIEVLPEGKQDTNYKPARAAGSIHDIQ